MKLYLYFVSHQDMLRLEAEVKSLHAAVDQVQVTLASPDLNRLSLREQLTQRQVITSFVVLNNNVNTLRLLTSTLSHY